MKFDSKKPHAVVIGHPWARYEQWGTLFDADGESRTNEPEPEIVVDEETPINGLDRDFALEHAREFLKTILAGGPITEKSVYKESEANNQDWQKVQKAFADLGGQKTKKGVWTYWKLVQE